METLATKQVYAGPWLTVREDTVRRPDGSSGTYGVVDSPDIVLVVPVEGDRLHLVEQYRYPVGGRRWEFPSGNAEEGIDVDAASGAARELREETGLLAGGLAHLGTLEITPSTMSQRCRVFLATDLTQGPPDPDPAEQDLRSAWFTRNDVARMIGEGAMTDSKSLAAYALLLVRGQ